MAKLKDRGMVLKRDDSFAARLDVAKPVEAPRPGRKTRAQAASEEIGGSISSDTEASRKTEGAGAAYSGFRTDHGI